MKAWVAGGWIAISGALLACGGCGFKGPLYLPERNATVVTHPAQGAQGTQGGQQTAPTGRTQTPAAAGKNKGKNSTPPASAPQSSTPPPQ
ncbi:MAG TPA: lipoprotein [Steroidobacteraceae bacterium]|nr:lipoprotein [Steroidobacteraceae bacterium]